MHDQLFAGEDARRAAVAARDAAADGRFVYAVRSTGVFCRPSCPSRAARPENLSFHADAAAARAAGFRPCRRCDPEGEGTATRRAGLVAEACRRIDAAEDAPDLDALARGAGVSRYHFHRLFKAEIGLTPRGYAAARRAARTGAALETAATVTEAIYAGGYGSGGRFYAAAPARLGMTPSARRQGGAGERIRFAAAPCSLGFVLVASTAKGIAAILLGDDVDTLMQDLRVRFPAAEVVPGGPDFASMVAAAVDLVENPGRGLALPLDVRGTAFQERVWQALRDIPPGTTLSYAEVAERVGAPKAVRAVAGACASNALAIAIPCHRVLRSDGALSGYRWGVARKRALLAREAEG